MAHDPMEIYLVVAASWQAVKTVITASLASKPKYDEDINRDIDDKRFPMLALPLGLDFLYAGWLAYDKCSGLEEIASEVK